MGGSKKQTVGYRYFAGMHMVLCHGPIDRITRITVDEKELWAGSNTGGSITVNKGDLFGGDSREGGISGTLDFMTGHASQLPNDYLVSRLGSLVPAFRGVVSVVLRQMYLSMNPYLKTWAFNVQRIFLQQDGSEQWQPEYAAIPNYTFYENLEKYADTPAMLAAWNESDPGNRVVWSLENHPVTGKKAIRGVYAVSGGSFISTLTLTVSGLVPGRTYTFHRDLYGFGPGAVTPQNGYIRDFEPVTLVANGAGQIFPNVFIQGPIGAGFVTYYYDNLYIEEGVPQIDMNPAHIIRECLTNRLWGMGYSEDDIDDDAFLSSAITMFNEKMGISLLWDTQTSIEEFIKIILQHIDAALYVDRRNGKFRLKLIRGDYDEVDLLVLDPSNIDKIEDFKRPAFGELNNAITVNYWDATKDQTGTVTVQDIALSQEQGGENATTATYEGFTNFATASRAAQRDLKTLSTPLITCTIYATKVGRNLNIGDVFILSWPDYQIESVVMRITGVAYGDGKTRRVRLQCVQDVFSYPEDAFVSQPPSGWVDPVGTPGAVRYQVGFELPYFELVRNSGQSVVDSSLAANPYVGYAGGACSPPVEASISALMYSDDGSGYDEAAVSDFCAGALLGDDIDYLATVFEINSGVNLSLVEAGEWLQIGSELMSVVSLVGSTLTVGRGVLDTIPAPHAAGSQVLFWDGYEAADPTEYVASDEIAIKFTATNGSGVYPLASATPIPVSIVGRAGKPFPPANVTINGEYYPTIAAGGLLIQWTTRNRILQTGGELVSWFTGTPVTPEVGATFTCRVFDNSIDVLIAEVVDTTDLSFSVGAGLFASSSEVRIELFSALAGRVCFQPFEWVMLLDNGDVPIDNMRDVGTLDELETLWRVTGIDRTQRVNGE